MRNSVLVVYVTCPPAKATAMATALVKSRVAACVNILSGVQSIYRWKNRLQKGRESLLVIKTTVARYQKLESAVLKLHPYELPEIIAVKQTRGHQPYLNWILDSCE